MGTRKPNLRSSIYYSEADGRWHGWVVMGTRNDGSQDRRHRSGKTEAEVTRKVRDLELQRDEGKAGKPGKGLTVEAWFRTWLTTIAPRTVSQTTIDSTYEPKIRRWIVPRLGKHRLDRLEPEHLDAFYAWLEEQGLKPNTVLQIHRIMSRALKVAWKRGKVARNVAVLIDAPTGEEVDIEPLSQEEARRILGAAATRRNGARWSVALAMGIRQSEALGLRWKFVDLDAGTIMVGWQLKWARYRHGCADPVACTASRHRVPCRRNCTTHRHRPGCGEGCTKRGHRCPEVKRPCPDRCTGHARECPQRTGGGWQFTRRKGVKPGRGEAKLVLALPRPLVIQLREHRRQQNAERLAAGAAWDDWDLVFCTPSGGPVNTHDDWEDWRELLDGAHVRAARVHDARHTAATLLLEQGIGIRVVQQILGHSQLSQTQRYTHVTARLSQDAADRMASALWPDQRELPRRPSHGEPPTGQLQPELQPERIDDGDREHNVAVQREWGGWGSNPRPTDYESAALTG
jgi:site-specific recombinase XerD